MTPQPLSVVVITLNEEANIERCLRSVAWAEERIVIDCGSSDRTVQSATELGARVILRDWGGYADQKNHGIEQAAHAWVLTLDADEWLDAQAAEEIRRTLAAPTADGYRVRRRTAFCGAYADRIWGGDRPLRLFRKERGRFEGGPVHESVRLAGNATTARLAGPILHAGYTSIADYVDKLNRYTGLAADGMTRSGRRFRPAKLWFGPFWTLFRLYVLKLGFLDGVRGWIIAAGSAYYVLVREAKLWERRPRQR
jgi:glycosyltransferase involved in cell wall biosynthesis